MLQRNNLVYCGGYGDLSGILIYQGKVRFVANISLIKKFRPSEKVEMLRLASENLAELEVVLQDFAKGPNPFMPQRLIGPAHTTLSLTPYPDRSITCFSDHRLALLIFHYNEQKASHIRRKGRTCRTAPDSFVMDWLSSVVSPYVDTGTGRQRRINNKNTCDSSLAPVRRSSHPYHRGSSTISRSRVSDEMSESGESSITFFTDSSHTLVNSPPTIFAEFSKASST